MINIIWAVITEMNEQLVTFNGKLNVDRLQIIFHIRFYGLIIAL